MFFQPLEKAFAVPGLAGLCDEGAAAGEPGAESGPGDEFVQEGVPRLDLGGVGFMRGGEQPGS